VLLTFDDGYADNYTHALPLLKELGLNATLFVSPGTVEDGYFLNWEQITEMHEAGWDIQPHGMTHPHLPRLKAEDQAHEIVEAKRQIEEQLGTTADIYCYPYGEYNQTTLTILKENGFRYAFTIDQGKTTNKQEAYKLKRVFVSGEESFNRFVYKLEKW
jgi:peptidoglycan/xylan/chitin deacetylase (PgdA/CDA1 family)